VSRLRRAREECHFSPVPSSLIAIISEKRNVVGEKKNCEEIIEKATDEKINSTNETRTAQHKKGKKFFFFGGEGGCGSRYSRTRVSAARVSAARVSAARVSAGPA
jgi:hypothetical protein